MNKILISSFLFLTACQTVPNYVFCFHDAASDANCGYAIQGNDFKVNNSGSNYTLDDKNWTLDQLEQNSFMIPPSSYAQIKSFLLNYCHANPSSCTYSSTADNFAKVEARYKRNLNSHDLADFEFLMSKVEKDLKDKWESEKVRR